MLFWYILIYYVILCMICLVAIPRQLYCTFWLHCCPYSLNSWVRLLVTYLFSYNRRWPARIGVTSLTICCYLLYFCSIVFFTNKFELIWVELQACFARFHECSGVCPIQEHGPDNGFKLVLVFVTLHLKMLLAYLYFQWVLFSHCDSDFNFLCTISRCR